MIIASNTGIYITYMMVLKGQYQLISVNWYFYRELFYEGTGPGFGSQNSKTLSVLIPELDRR